MANPQAIDPNATRYSVRPGASESVTIAAPTSAGKVIWAVAASIDEGELILNIGTAAGLAGALLVLYSPALSDASKGTTLTGPIYVPPDMGIYYATDVAAGTAALSVIYSEL